jgi:ribosome-associated toxin RatA of RatAB toxin-antitoxin module
MHYTSLSGGKSFMACVKQAGRFTCLVGGLLLAGPVAGEGGAIDADGWSLVETTAAGRIYHREVEGSSVPWAKIVTTFDAPPERVHAVVVDYEHFAEFIPNVFKSRIMADEGKTRWVYHHLRFSGPIADRAYLIRSTERECRTRQSCYRVEWTLDDRSFQDIDLSAGIQPKVFSGFWELRSTEKPNGTEARYAVHSEPGGFIPGWLVTRMTDRYMQQVVEAVRERLGAGG